MTVTISGSTGLQNPAGSAAAPSVGTSQAGIFFPANNTMAFSTNSAQAMYIDANGNVGITTNNPLVGLDLAQRPDAISLPKGVTSSRPVIPVAGMLRFNTDNSTLDIYNGTTWGVLPSFNSSGNVGIGSTTPVAALDISQRTDAIIPPSGTTAQRPGSPVAGMTRYNTTLLAMEVYQNGTWSSLATVYSVDYLVVAGGGGGGNYNSGGGGGAGGYISGTTSVVSPSVYTITVGGGGNGSTQPSGSDSTAGSASVFGGLTATGGGKGGSNTGATSGGSGGSGGGAANSGTFGTGTAGQGNNGGTATSASPNYAGGGGGGASAVGGNGTSTTGGAGGAGTTWVNGSTYAGGGGGSVQVSGTAGGAGGAGGGGAGGTNIAGTAGTPNTGGGGGAGGYLGSTTYNGAGGGSGIVIIRYLGTQRGTGGTVTSAGGYTYHTFTTSSTYTA